jgi:hypothetical protein
MFGQEKAIGRMTVQSITRTMRPHDPDYFMVPGPRSWALLHGTGPKEPGPTSWYRAQAAGPYFVAGSFFSRSSARFFSVSSSLDFGMSST